MNKKYYHDIDLDLDFALKNFRVHNVNDDTEWMLQGSLTPNHRGLHTFNTSLGKPRWWDGNGFVTWEGDGKWDAIMDKPNGGEFVFNTAYGGPEVAQYGALWMEGFVKGGALQVGGDNTPPDRWAAMMQLGYYDTSGYIQSRYELVLNPMGNSVGVGRYPEYTLDVAGELRAEIVPTPFAGQQWVVSEEGVLRYRTTEQLLADLNLPTGGSGYINNQTTAQTGNFNVVTAPNEVGIQTTSTGLRVSNAGTGTVARVSVYSASLNANTGEMQGSADGSFSLFSYAGTRFSHNAITSTSGAKFGLFLGVNSGANFSPTSGSATYSALNLNPTINQSGTSTGAVYGLLYNPVLTSVLGTHYFLYGATGNNVFNATSGTTYWGSTASTVGNLTINPYAASGAHFLQYGGNGTNKGFVGMDAANASASMTSFIGVYGSSAYIGGGAKGVIDVDIDQTNPSGYNLYGFRIKWRRSALTSQTLRTYGFFADVMGSATSGYTFAFYGENGDNYFAGNTGIGAAVDASYKLRVQGNLLLGGLSGNQAKWVRIVPDYALAEAILIGTPTSTGSVFTGVRVAPQHTNSGALTAFYSDLPSLQFSNSIATAFKATGGSNATASFRGFDFTLSATNTNASSANYGGIMTLTSTLRTLYGLYISTSIPEVTSSASNTGIHILHDTRGTGISRGIYIRELAPNNNAFVNCSWRGIEVGANFNSTTGFHAALIAENTNVNTSPNNPTTYTIYARGGALNRVGHFTHHALGGVSIGKYSSAMAYLTTNGMAGNQFNLFAASPTMGSSGDYALSNSKGSWAAFFLNENTADFFSDVNGSSLAKGGLRIETSGSVRARSGFTFTNYGLWVDAQGSVDDNWAIYSNAGRNYFAEGLEIKAVTVDPAGYNGRVTYSSATNRFRGYVGGVWKAFLMEGDVAGNGSQILNQTTKQVGASFNIDGSGTVAKLVTTAIESNAATGSNVILRSASANLNFFAVENNAAMSLTSAASTRALFTVGTGQTITTGNAAFFSMYASRPTITLAAGGVAELYGYYHNAAITDQNGGATKTYAFYGANGDNYFAGNTGIGTAVDAAYKLKVSGAVYFDAAATVNRYLTIGADSINNQASLEFAYNNNGLWRMRMDGPAYQVTLDCKLFGNYGALFLWNNNGDFHAAGDVVGFSTSLSDKRLKKNLKKIDGIVSLNSLKSLTAYSFEWAPYPWKGEDMGFMAQDVAKIFPQAVREKKMPLLGGESYLTVDYKSLLVALLPALLSVDEKVEKDKAEKEAMKNEIKLLKEDIKKLKEKK